MEEEQYRDILLLLELLTNLLSKDFIDLSPLDSQEPEDNMTAADVCLYGLNIIMPVSDLKNQMISLENAIKRIDVNLFPYGKSTIQ
jgi:hypothetical protein